jgi:hypothetical protein
MLVLLIPSVAVLMAPVVGRMQEARAGRMALGALAVSGCLLLWVIASMPALAFVSARLRVEEAVAARLGFNPLGFLPAVPYGTADGPTLIHGLILAALAGTAIALAVRSGFPARWPRSRNP